MAKTNIRFRLQKMGLFTVKFQVLEQRVNSVILGLSKGVALESHIVMPGARERLFHVVTHAYPSLEISYISVRGNKSDSDDRVVRFNAADLPRYATLDEYINMILISLEAWSYNVNRGWPKPYVIRDYRQMPLSEDGIYEF